MGTSHQPRLMQYVATPSVTVPGRPIEMSVTGVPSAITVMVSTTCLIYAVMSVGVANRVVVSSVPLSVNRPTNVFVPPVSIAIIMKLVYPFTRAVTIWSSKY